MRARRLNGRRVLERVITYDARIPFSDDDADMDDGWRMIPVPPTADYRWFILDNRSDRKATWGRRCRDGDG